MSRVDREYMMRALRLAKHGQYTTDPNPNVGCVLVNHGEIVGEGWHAMAGGPHAEVSALQQAGENARGATAYVSLEPCSHHGRTPPCSQALIAAGVVRVVAAMQDPNPQVAGQGMAALQAAGMEIQTGLLADAAGKLNPGFLKRMREGRPLLRCKLAMSLDGRTAMASGESQWISGEAARLDVQHLRARSSAIMTGVGTLLADDPSMNVRLEGARRQPLRIVLDPHLSTPPAARMLGLPGRTLIVTACDELAVHEPLQAAGAEVLVLPQHKDVIDLHALMGLLGRMEINEVLLETGATLSGAMLQAGLIDELIIYMAPHLMGGNARGLFHLPGLDRMEQRIRLDILDMRAVGKDWRITARPYVEKA